MVSSPVPENGPNYCGSKLQVYLQSVQTTDSLKGIAFQTSQYDVNIWLVLKIFKAPVDKVIIILIIIWNIYNELYS